MKKLILFWTMVVVFFAVAAAHPNQCYFKDAVLDEDSCPPITNLVISEITGTSASISWSGVSTDNSVTYTLEYSLSGENTWSTEASSISSTTFLLGGLYPLTTYDVRVRTNCSDTSESNWTIVTFTTTCLSGGEVTIGTSTTVSYDLPSQSLYKYGYAQQLFLASEIGYATNIYALSINMNAVNSPRQFDFYLMHTNQTEITSWLPTTGAQLVYSCSPAQDTLATGWNRFEFPTPFAYNGTDNLLLIIIDKTGSYAFGNLGVVHTAFTNCTQFAYRDSTSFSIATTPSLPGNALDVRNNIIFSCDCNEETNCLAPTMNVDNVTSVSADVNWIAGYQETEWDLEYKAANTNNWISVPNPVNGFHTLTNLIPNTSYQVRIRAVCGAQNTSDWTTVSFRTGCGIQPIPFSENFNTYGIGQSAFPTCWSQQNTYSYPYPYITTPNNLDSTGGSLYFMASTSTYNMAITPVLGANINSLSVSFYLRVVDVANGMIIGAMSDPTDINTFVAIDTVYCNAASVFEYKEVYLNNYTGTGSHIAFKNYTITTGYTSRMMWLDDMVIDSLPSCNIPTNFNVVSTTETTVQLSWTENGQAQNWIIEYGPAGFTPGAGISVLVNTNPYTVTNLDVGTAYDFYVQSSCDENNVSLWAGPVHISTMCLPFDMPFVETFNNVTSGIPVCWDNREGTTTDETFKWSLLINGMEGHGMFFNSYYNASGNTNALKTPRINIEESAELKFYYMNPTGGDLSVYAIANGAQTLLVGGLVDTAVWTIQTCDLSAYAGQTIQISFVGTSNYGTGNAYIYLDSVSIQTVIHETCFAPNNVVVSEVTHNSAIINWSQTGDADSWTILYKKGDETNWNSITNVTSHPYTLINLDPETVYSVKVTAVCGEGNSEESNTVNFTTDADGVNHFVLKNTILFPNPTTGQVTIQNAQCIMETVEILDVYGKLLTYKEVNDSTTTIDVTNYASGVYLVRVHTDKGIVTKRIIKE